MKPCNTFKCTDSDSCQSCYNGECTGTGWDASTHCGCDCCEYSRYIGDECTCELKRYSATKKVINELRDIDEYEEWPDHDHRKDI